MQLARLQEEVLLIYFREIKLFQSKTQDVYSYCYCKRRNASGLLISFYDYIGVEKFAARWSATKCEISTLNSPSCCHQLVQQLIIIG